jgi:glycine reductase complex component B subunit gamma
MLPPISLVFLNYADANSEKGVFESWKQSFGSFEVLDMSIRIVHYVNQFFAGIGGEDQASIGPGVKEGAAGPAIGLEKALAGEGIVLATVYCGDNYIAEGQEDAANEVVDLIKTYQPDVVVAGPAFGSGRHGLACGYVCRAVTDNLAIPAITSMYVDSPGAAQFAASVTIVPTTETAAGMGKALAGMARLALKLAAGEQLGMPEEDGYIPRGYRKNEFSEKIAATRAVEMLLKKMGNETFHTEWPLPRYERITPPAAHQGTDGMKVALLSEGGLVPKGNPDALPSGWATTWFKYDISQVENLLENEYESVHGGIDTSHANQDPDRIIPLDVMKELEHAGVLQLHDQLYSTVGNMGALVDMRRIGNEMAEDMLAAGVNAVIIGAT